MITFDGKTEAAIRLDKVKQRVQLFLPRQLKIFSLVSQEDEPSKIYTRLKKKDAQNIGIDYEDVYFPILTPMSDLLERIQSANKRADVDGIIIQKPMKALMPSPEWWDQLRNSINPKKDVDGLNPSSKVVSATARAVLEILEAAAKALKVNLQGKRAVVLGRSDIVGAPVANELKKQGIEVSLFGRKEFSAGKELLKQADIVIAATGQENLVQPEMLKQGVIAIDAGSPQPEISPVGLEKVAVFSSPVPGGVGPMTRVCLLENLLDLVESS